MSIDGHAQKKHTAYAAVSAAKIFMIASQFLYEQQITIYPITMIENCDYRCFRKNNRRPR